MGDLYEKLGVSSDKKEVHEAIKDIDKGLYPNAFCKIIDDLCDRPDYCSIFHADGAGTKSSLAYMMYKETGNIEVFRGIVQDAIIMNIDDLLCVGATEKIFLSNNIGRHAKFISGEIIATIVNEYERFSEFLTTVGVPVSTCGGETADVGDLVKTLIVDASVFTTMKREDVIDAGNIKPNDVIVGLASSGKASYEDKFNSGIGSNGLTLARHGVLSHDYYKKYPECYDYSLEESLIFFGKHKLLEEIPEIGLTIGEAILSPTRTYAPIIVEVLKKFRQDINGIIHNSGGGQTKTIKFGKGIKYVKDNLFETPILFEIIKESSGTSWKEMYQVFNMGHRMEIICKENIADEIIKISKKFNVDAKIIGHCKPSSVKDKNQLEIKTKENQFKY